MKGCTLVSVSKKDNITKLAPGETAVLCHNQEVDGSAGGAFRTGKIENNVLKLQGKIRKLLSPLLQQLPFDHSKGVNWMLDHGFQLPPVLPQLPFQHQYRKWLDTAYTIAENPTFSYFCFLETPGTFASKSYMNGSTWQNQNHIQTQLRLCKSYLYFCTVYVSRRPNLQEIQLSKPVRTTITGDEATLCWVHIKYWLSWHSGQWQKETYLHV